MGESDSSDSSMGYSTSESQGDKIFSRIRALKKTRLCAKGKPQEEGRGDLVPVRAAIEHNDEDPEAGAFRKKIEEDYRDVLFEKIYAHEIDPECRGENGVATIRLKEGYMPKKEGAFRLKGKRENGFKKLMEKFKKNGWIGKSNSAWGARAFVVPKPGCPGEDQMVVDYRHLNLMTEDDCHVISNIEDMISAESQNTLSSIFDLEDGFHQMHLPPEASP